MENFEPIQTLIGDLTIEQFCHVLVIAFGIFTVSSFVVFIVFCFLNSYSNGRLHYKTKEYYGSFRYLNKRFKALKKADCPTDIKSEFLQLRNSIELLRYQRVIPEFLYISLTASAYEIYEHLVLKSLGYTDEMIDEIIQHRTKDLFKDYEVIKNEDN